MDDKNCELIFSDGRPSYAFASTTPLELVLNTAKERDWPLTAIKTPHYTLSVFTHDEYERAVANSTFENLGV